MTKQKVIIGFILLLLCILPVVQAQDATPIGYGDTVNGRITNTDEAVFYWFEGRKGDQVVLMMESETVDVLLRLGDADGNVLAENDDISSTNLNAQIEFTLPADGQYLIAALAYDRGRYTLTLDVDGTQSQAQIGSLSYGDEVSGQAINMDDPVAFSFSGDAGDTVSIAVNSDEVDTYVVLVDANGNALADNDDISSTNLNSYLEAVLPANGDYLVGVFAYDSGPFTLVLDQVATGGTAPVADTGPTGEVYNGQITNDTYYVEYPLNGVGDGQTIVVDARATGGDLDAYLGLFYGDTVVAENDDRDQSTTDSYIEYPEAQGGDYTVVVTRYGFDQGETSGSFEVGVKVGRGATAITTGGSTSVNPIASGYPSLSPTPNIADWTVLVYMGGDNNLEDGLENDLDEFERAGGSTDSVRIVTLFDRSDSYSRSNGNWSDTRLIEPGRDTSRDAQFNYPPTIDTRPIGNLGELDTAYGQNLLEFLVWGIQTYPAQRFAVIINDHGGAWSGTVTDETTGQGILTIPALAQAFDAALKATGRQKFDLLINDACLMSSLEHYAAMARYFDYAIGSPEITLNPSFDMDLLTQALNQNPNVDMRQLGKLLVDKYLEDMKQISSDTYPVLGAVTTDLRKFGDVITALDGFTEVVNSNPDAYGSVLGQVRGNTYPYSFFLPEEQFGPHTIIDIGDFMTRVANGVNDRQLSGAASRVLNALDEVRMYAAAGDQLAGFSHYYNIYYPARASDYDPQYLQQSPLQNWALMLRNLYGSVSPGFRGIRAPAGAPSTAPSLVPIVTITNLFPTEGNVQVPITVSMEVTGRNITKGSFTVDQVQSDGSAIRMRTANIVTIVVQDGVVNEINQWNPGVDDSDFTWEVELPFVTDGTTTNYEEVVTTDSVSSIAGRYRFPGDNQWNEVTVIFGDNGETASVISRHSGSTALANLTPQAGGEFQAYRSVVTPDGQIQLQPGTLFTWPQEGLHWDMGPAPSGEYNLGFLVEAVGGVTGFASAKVTINNDEADTELRGYVDDDWGFVMQRPADWFDVNYFPDPDWLQTGDLDNTQYVFVYPVYSEDAKGGDLKAIAQAALDRFDLKPDSGFNQITVDDKDALEFTFNYTNDDGDYTAHAFAVYIDYLDMGLVFSAEAENPDDTDRFFKLLVDTTFFFNAQDIKDQDTGVWKSDTYIDAKYPVPTTWLPGAEENSWWVYHLDDQVNNPSKAAILVFEVGDSTAEEMLQQILDDDISILPGYRLTGTEIYYGELNTWETAFFTHDGPRGESITGRLYVTVKDNVPYALWFESPTQLFDQNFRQYFTVMLDGFKINDAQAASS